MSGNFFHSANCPCGWCNGGWRIHRPRGPAAGTREDHDCGDSFCKTPCEKCGAPVFSVHHKRGIVWFDDLCHPLPKHSCFPDDLYGSELRRTLRRASLQVAAPVFGVVTEVEVLEPREKGRIVITCSNGQNFETTFEQKYSTIIEWAGALVYLETSRLKQIYAHRWDPRWDLTKEDKLTFEGDLYIWDGTEWYKRATCEVMPARMQQRLNAWAAEGWVRS